MMTVLFSNHWKTYFQFIFVFSIMLLCNHAKKGHKNSRKANHVVFNHLFKIFIQSRNAIKKKKKKNINLGKKKQNRFLIKTEM